MSDFFDNLVAGFKSVIPKIETDVAIVAPAAEMAIPVVETLFPVTAPVINEGTQIIKTVSTLAPGATSSATGAIAEIEAIFAAGSAEITRLRALFSSLGAATTVGQSIVVTPAVTTATQPVAAPGAALS